MSQNYKESIDGRGRTVIVLEKDPSTALIVCGALGFAPLFAAGWLPARIVLANLLVFGAGAAWLRFAQKRTRMRVMIDPAGRTIAFGTRVRARELAFADVASAQVKSQDRAGGPAYRVDLALASGEVVPLIAGFATFSVDECQRLADRINQSLSK